MNERENNLLNISWLCETAGVSRSGYYRWLNTVDTRNEKEERDKKYFELILEAYKFRGYDKGSRGIHMRLLNQGIRMNRKKIQRLMSKYGLKCPIRKANPYRFCSCELFSYFASFTPISTWGTNLNSVLREDVRESGKVLHKIFLAEASWGFLPKSPLSEVTDRSQDGGAATEPRLIPLSL